MSKAVSKEEKFEMRGVVTEVLPSARFKVKLDNGYEIMAYPSGKLRLNVIEILRGDRVTVEISAYDLTRGRIVWRNR